MATQIKLRRDTAANWTQANPVLALAEPGFETDTGKLKIGDGSTAWSNLEYFVTEGVVDLTGYATEQFVNSAIENIEIPGVDNSFDHIELTGRTVATGVIVEFVKPENTSLVDIIDDGLTLTRPAGEGAGLINIAVEVNWDPGTSPANTRWNWDGWTNLDTVKTRNYASLRQTLKHRIGGNIVGAELVMHDITNDKYYKIKVTNWAQGPAHTGAVTYTRELIDTSYKVGIEFPDGTSLVTRPKDFIDLPQIFSGDTNEYILGLNDRGKHVYVFTESVIKIPTEAQVNFPIGSTFIVITGEITGQNGVRITCTAPMSIEREGQTGQQVWQLKPYSTLILVKIASNKWNLSGAVDLSDYALASSVPTDVSDLTDNQGLLGGSGGSGEGLGTITVPATPIVLYKGLQASYGMVHSNNDSDELNVNKIVIHKPAATTTTIHPTSNNDDFEVSGLGSSDILAMFVVYGDANEAKSLSDLRAFAQAVIDNVILDGGVEGAYNTLDDMKAAFYDNYETLATAANGLYTDFEFFTINTIFDVTASTLIQGSGAVFEISDLGNGTYNPAAIQNPGINYRSGHKIKVLGTDLGGVTPDNDCIITVDSIDEGGAIFQWSLSGTAAGTVAATYGPVTGTNYDVGRNIDILDVQYDLNSDNINLNVWNGGSNYVAGDQIRILGTDIRFDGEPLVSPDNDLIVTVITVDSIGSIISQSLSGTLPRPQPIWRENSISDGGADQYDTGNFISTNLAQNINYNDGDTVVDGTAAFGAGSTYTFVYDTAIFGLFATGSSATLIRTSGNSGADGNSITEAGNLFGDAVPEQTFDNAVTHLNLVSDLYAGPLVSFTKTNNGNEVDILIADDGEGAGVGITRDGNQGIYNPYRDEEGWTSGVSPSGTLWNTDGWAGFSDIESRTYRNLYAAFGSGGLGNKIVGAECVMYLPDNGKYYAVKFTQWTQNNQGGGFAYTRQEINLDRGIRFPDGTRQTTAYSGADNVKLRSPGSRRIEEVHGYKQVSVTSKTTGTRIITTAANNAGNTNYVELNVEGANRDALIALANGDAYYRVQVSLNESDWATGRVNGWGSTSVTIQFESGIRLAVSDTDTVYYRILTGGAPVTWWDKDDLPGGSTNFRGAIIKYHAYTGDATWIGTIHIVDDDGEEHITHTEVQSGVSDGENDDLWLVPNEGTIQYRRLDDESATLKIQWTATVFYGSETND
jgi:hypothetical protein